MGALEYPPGTGAHAEINGQLSDLGYIEAYDRAMAAAGRNAGARRAAQLELLNLVRSDPIELFRQLRSERPVLDLPDLDMYVVTRDRDVRRILDNPTVFSVRDYRDRMGPVVGAYMLNRDAHPYYNIEEKPWMRSLMLRSDLPRIRQIVREATEAGIRQSTTQEGRLDVVPALGRGVPVVMVQEYFGFHAPTDDMLRWSFRTQDSFFHNVVYLRGFIGFLVRSLGVGGKELQRSQRSADEVHRAAFTAGAEMRDFLDAYVADRDTEIRAEDTVLARMLRANSELAHPKQMDRIRSNIMGGLIGSVETSNAAIVQALNQLLARPEVLEQARQAAAAVGPEDAIERSEFAQYVWEGARFHPITPFVVRYVHEDTVIGDRTASVRLRKGRRVLVATHSAMHDPRAVRSPDRFLIDRPAREREMNLGYGMHRCLGDYIAQVMVPEVVRQLVLLPDVEHVTEGEPIEDNQGIDFGKRGSFPEHYVVRHTGNRVGSPEVVDALDF